MSDTLHFDQPVALEVRDFEKREIYARIIPYGEQIKVRGRPESFARGAAAGIDPTSIRLLLHHDPSRVIGRSIALEEREDGAYALFRVSKTADGDEGLELARDGALDVSPGFVPGSQTSAGVHTRLAALPEASLVTFAAYPSAKVLAVRKGETMSEETTTETTEKVESKTDVDIEKRMADVTALLEERSAEIDALTKRQEKIDSAMNAPGARGGAGRIVSSKLTAANWGLALLEQFAGKTERREQIAEEWAKLQKRVGDGEIETRDVYDEMKIERRALADITGGQDGPGDVSPSPTDLSGLVVEEFMADQLVNILSRRRPVFDALGSIRMPRSGYARIPTVTQHTRVRARGDQKTEVPSQKMILSTAPYEAEWIAGAVDIAIELRKTAEIDILALVTEDLFGQYAKATELDTTVGQHGNPVGVVPFIEAGGHGFTYTGNALATTSYENFIAAVYAASETVEDNTDLDATVLVVTRAQFRAIAGMVDANDRRLFSVLGPTNADATAGFNAKRISLPDGPTIIKARSNDLTQAVLTNDAAFKVSDGGPELIGPVRNVGLMGDDVGVLGRTMLVPRIPAGVVVFGNEPS